MAAAEQLFAELGVNAVSHRQVSLAAGLGNNAAVGYHFGTKTDLVRAIEQRHRPAIERLLEPRVADAADSADLRDWIACLVGALTGHLAQLPNPTWYARFAARAMADPEYHHTIVADALASPVLVQVLDGIAGCLPPLPTAVVTQRGVMARHVLMRTCADYEYAFATGTEVPENSWRAVASGLTDAIVGLWLAPVTRHDPNGNLPWK